MGRFELRRECGSQFEREVERYLIRHPDIRCVARNGTEHTHPEFALRLRGLASDAAKFVRFAPDGVALSRDAEVFHWEAKSSRFMERDAWETYCRHERLGCQILLFLRTSGGVFSSWATALPFVDSRAVVERYPPERRFPVIDGWIHPRAGNHQGRLLVGSGTPFREIDLDRCDRLMPLTEWQAMTADNPESTTPPMSIDAQDHAA